MKLKADRKILRRSKSYGLFLLCVCMYSVSVQGGTYFPLYIDTMLVERRTGRRKRFLLLTYANNRSIIKIWLAYANNDVAF